MGLLYISAARISSRGPSAGRRRAPRTSTHSTSATRARRSARSGRRTCSARPLRASRPAPALPQRNEGPAVPIPGAAPCTSSSAPPVAVATTAPRPLERPTAARRAVGSCGRSAGLDTRTCGRTRAGARTASGARARRRRARLTAHTAAWPPRRRAAPGSRSSGWAQDLSVPCWAASLTASSTCSASWVSTCAANRSTFAAATARAASASSFPRAPTRTPK
jgi:hypothetical protein